MGMHYDTEIFNKYRDRAVTKTDDLVIGATYYGNADYPFVLSEIITDTELNRRTGGGCGEGKEMWLIDDKGSSRSTSDRNIGDRGGYNPWLLFADEAVAKECCENLAITWDADPYDDYDYWATEDMSDLQYDLEDQ